MQTLFFTKFTGISMIYVQTNFTCLVTMIH